jgi:putative ABC transport system permease protein
VGSIRQSGVLLWSSVRAMPTRAMSSSIGIFGFAGVCAMLVVLLSGREAILGTYERSGRDNVAVIMMGEAAFEGASVIVPPIALEIERMPGIVHTPDGAAVSKEFVGASGVHLLVESNRVGIGANARGVTSRAFEVRPQLRIVAGRRFESGRFEVIASRSIAEQYGVHVGSKVRMQKGTLSVVGIFENGGGSADMEVWGDKAVFASLLTGGGGANSAAGEATSVLWVLLAGPQLLPTLQHAIRSSTLPLMKSFNIRARSEREFLRVQSGGLVKGASEAAISVGLVMGIGALFGAINSMYAAVGHRSREIATLRAIGFSALPITSSIVGEAVILSLAGGLIGVAAALLATHDRAFSLYNDDASTRLAVQFLPSADILVAALGYVLVLGMFSSILPCMRALRCPIPAGLLAR